MQPEESLEKICYGKEIWKRKVADRWEEDKEENGGQISYRDSKDRDVAIQNGTEKSNIKLQHTGRPLLLFWKEQEASIKLLRVVIGFKSEFQ